MSKEKFDLSNVGGQPKDWMQKSREAEVEASGSWWVPWALIGLPVLLLICAGSYLFSLFKFASKFH